MQIVWRGRTRRKLDPPLVAFTRICALKPVVGEQHFHFSHVDDSAGKISAEVLLRITDRSAIIGSPTSRCGSLSKRKASNSPREIYNGNHEGT